MTIEIKCEHCNTNERELEFEETGFNESGLEYQTYYCTICNQETILII